MTLHDPIAAMGELLLEMRAADCDGADGRCLIPEAPEITDIRCPGCSGGAYLERELGPGRGDDAWIYTCAEGCGFECGHKAAEAIYDLACDLGSARSNEMDLRRYLIRVGVEKPEVRWEGVGDGEIAHAMLRGTRIAACGRRPIVTKVQGPRVWSFEMPGACPRCWAAIAESGPLSLEDPR